MKTIKFLILAALLLLFASSASAQGGFSLGTGVLLDAHNTPDVYVIDPAGNVRLTEKGDGAFRPIFEGHYDMWSAAGVDMGPSIMFGLSDSAIVDAVGLGLSFGFGPALRLSAGGWYDRGDLLASDVVVGQPLPDGLTAIPVVRQGLWRVVAFFGVDPTGF